MTENMPEYPTDVPEGPQPAEAPQPGAPTDEEIAEDSNLWAPAEASDDAAVDENGNDPDES